MKHIGIFGNIYSEESDLRRFFDALSDHDVAPSVEKDFSDFLRDKGLYGSGFNTMTPEDMESLNVAISLGGDGTFLKAATKINPDTPIVGINTGSLGFLADIDKFSIEKALADVIAENYVIEERSLLHVSSESHGSGGSLALNEVLVTKNDTAVMLTIHIYIDGEHIAKYQSDGLVISTPTGSTGHSLSYGGPITSPQCAVFVLNPVAPHSLSMARSIIVPDSAKMKFSVESRNASYMVALDGTKDQKVLPNGAVFRVEKAEQTIKSIRLSGSSFFSTLNRKLGWG